MSINKLDQIIQSTNGDVKYARADAAADALQQSHLENNASKIGLSAYSQYNGFVSVSQQTDYPSDTLVMGDGMALFSTNDVQVENLVIDTDLIGLEGMTVPTWYDISSGAKEGNNPILEIRVTGGSGRRGRSDVPIEKMSDVIGKMTGQFAVPSNPHRILTTGSMTTIENTLTSLEGAVGPFLGGLGDFDRLVPGEFTEGVGAVMDQLVAVTSPENISYATQYLSSIFPDPPVPLEGIFQTLSEADQLLADQVAALEGLVDGIVSDALPGGTDLV